MTELVLGENIQQIFQNDNPGSGIDSQMKKNILNGRNMVNETKLRKMIPFDCPEAFEALICECVREDASLRPLAER